MAAPRLPANFYQQLIRMLGSGERSIGQKAPPLVFGEQASKAPKPTLRNVEDAVFTDVTPQATTSIPAGTAARALSAGATSTSTGFDWKSLLPYLLLGLGGGATTYGLIGGPEDKQRGSTSASTTPPPDMQVNLPSVADVLGATPRRQTPQMPSVAAAGTAQSAQPSSSDFLRKPQTDYSQLPVNTQLPVPALNQRAPRLSLGETLSQPGVYGMLGQLASVFDPYNRLGPLVNDYAKGVAYSRLLGQQGGSGQQANPFVLASLLGN